MGICQEEKIRKNPNFEEINNDESNNFVHEYQYYKKIYLNNFCFIYIDVR